MLNRQVNFEWLHGEDVFQQLGAPPIGLAERFHVPYLESYERRIAHWAARITGLFVVVLALTASASLSRFELDQIQLRGDLDQILRQETHAWLTRDRDLFDSLVDRRVEQRWIHIWRRHLTTDRPTQHEAEAQLVNVSRWGDYLRATVVGVHPVTEWWEYERYTETRFYRPSDNGWLRTLPPADFWGEQHTTTTPHFYLVYYDPDIQVVQTAGRQLEAAHTYLRELFDLPEPKRAGKQQIAIAPEHSLGWRSSYGQWELISPALLSTPEGWSAAEHTSSYLVERLIYQEINQHWPGFSSLLTYRWPMMLVAFTGWMQSDITKLQSPWRRDAEQVFVEYGAEHFPIDLKAITELKRDGPPNRQRVIWRYVAAESVVDYAVQTYGRERLPELMESFLTHDTWDSIIEDVYGLSSEEFRAGWNAYLAARYGFSAP